MNAKLITQHRLLAQGIQTTPFSNPVDVVYSLGAVQAQDYLGSLWGIGLRMKSATEKTIEKAIADKKIVRSWPMRGTLHFTAAEDLRWMLKYLTPRVIKRSASLYRQAGLDTATLKKSAKVIARALEGGKQMPREELYAELEKNKISTSDVRGLHILGHLAQEALICFGTREGKQHRFTLLEEWLPPSEMLSLDEAMGELARRYFTSHGPATINDFAWWTGLSLTEARRGLDIVKSQLHAAEWEDQVFWMAKDLPDIKSIKSVYLLPAYDEYTVAYKDRSLMLDAAHAVKAKNGIFTSVIVVDGKIAGTWRRTLGKDSVVIEKEFFKKTGAPVLSTAFKKYGEFIGLKIK
jgi:hypothetical protein